MGPEVRRAEVQPVAHPRELVADPGGHLLVQGELAGERLVVGEGVAHLVARDVGGLAGLLHVHPELHHVQEELQEVLVLGVRALHGEGEEGLRRP